MVVEGVDRSVVVGWLLGWFEVGGEQPRETTAMSNTSSGTASRDGGERQVGPLTLRGCDGGGSTNRRLKIAGRKTIWTLEVGKPLQRSRKVFGGKEYAWRGARFTSQPNSTLLLREYKTQLLTRLDRVGKLMSQV